MAFRALIALALFTVLVLPAPAAAVPTYVETYTSTITPEDLELAADGTLYASGNTGASETIVQRFTSTTSAMVLKSGTSGPGAHHFDFSGLALDPDKAVYAVNGSPTADHRLLKIVENGTNVDNFGDGDANLSGPLDIERSPTDGRFYVSDESGNKVSVFDSNGAFISSFNGTQGGGAAFQVTQGLDVAADGKVYVADRNNRKVRVFEHDGTFYGDFPQLPDTGVPRDVAVDGNLVYVTDINNDKVRVYSLSTGQPELVESFGGSGTAPGSFSLPTGITIGPDGDIYVADNGDAAPSGRVQRFTYNPGGGNPDPGGGGGGNPGGGGGTPTQGAINGNVVPSKGSQQGFVIGIAKVEACLTDGRGCRTTATDEYGHFMFPGAVNGEWTVRAFPGAEYAGAPSDALTVTVAGEGVLVELRLPALKPKPAKTTIGGEAGEREGEDGVPIIDWNSPSTVTTKGCAGGSVRLKVFFQGRYLQETDMKPVPPPDSQGLVTYVGKIRPLFPAHGHTVVEFAKTCKKSNPPEEAQPAAFDVYIDPSGNIRTVQGAPVVGAQVTLLQKDPATGLFVAPPTGDPVMSPSNRTNPDVSRIDGGFGWDVLAGTWKVHVTKAGCHKPGDKSVPFIETEELIIPPAVTGLDLRMDCPDKVKPKLSKLGVKKRVLSVSVSEAATVKTVLQRCKGKRCRKVKAFSAKAKFARRLDTTLPKSVRKGRYKVTATATDLARNRAKPLVRTLRVK